MNRQPQRFTSGRYQQRNRAQRQIEGGTRGDRIYRGIPGLIRSARKREFSSSSIAWILRQVRTKHVLYRSADRSFYVFEELLEYCVASFNQWMYGSHKNGAWTLLNASKILLSFCLSFFLSSSSFDHTELSKLLHFTDCQNSVPFLLIITIVLYFRHNYQ